MTRRRWVYVNGTDHEVGVDYTGPARPLDSGALWGDSGYAGLRATDGTDISTRTKHREYMRLKGLATIDDFTNVTAAALKRKAEYVTEGKHGAVRREHIERAIHDLQQRRK